MSRGCRNAPSLTAFGYQHEPQRDDAFGRKLRGFGAFDVYAAAHRSMQPGECAHECGLAGAVRAKQGESFAAAHVQADVVQDRIGAIAGIEMSNAERFACAFVG
jgi:hypothetical protein